MFDHENEILKVSDNHEATQDDRKTFYCPLLPIHYYIDKQKVRNKRIRSGPERLISPRSRFMILTA